jgi:hypothetical protein
MALPLTRGFIQTRCFPPIRNAPTSRVSADATRLLVPNTATLSATPFRCHIELTFKPIGFQRPYPVYKSSVEEIKMCHGADELDK